MSPYLLAPPHVWAMQGVFKGVTSIFFSYVGFDMVASMAEEAVNPSVDLPVGILGSIAAATAIYIAMSTVLTGNYLKRSQLPTSFAFGCAYSPCPCLLPQVASTAAVHVHLVGTDLQTYVTFQVHSQTV